MNFREQILACLPRLRAYARSMGGSNHAADDLIQATALRALVAEDRFELGTNMMAWLFTIMRNIHTSEVRYRSLRHSHSLEDLPEHLLQAPAAQLAAVQNRELREALKRVPHNQREALVLVVMVGCSYDEAALICGCEVGTIKSRVNRAKARLAELLRASDTPAELVTRERTIYAERHRKQLRVLIVEDELVIANEYERLLNELGAAPVGKASNAADAVRLADEHRPDLVLMDVRLRGTVDGVTAAIDIGSKLNTRIVFVTAFSDRPVRDRITAFNGSQPLSKPLGLPELAAVLVGNSTAHHPPLQQASIARNRAANASASRVRSRAHTG
jgi:RNA polymerase sigma-70 factor, ECF subfamily